jgi:hypothetical protein
LWVIGWDERDRFFSGGVGRVGAPFHSTSHGSDFAKAARVKESGYALTDPELACELLPRVTSIVGIWGRSDGAESGDMGEDVGVVWWKGSDLRFRSALASFRCVGGGGGGVLGRVVG